MAFELYSAETANTCSLMLCPGISLPRKELKKGTREERGYFRKGLKNHCWYSELKGEIPVTRCNQAIISAGVLFFLF